MENDEAILNDFYTYFLTHAVSNTIVGDYLKSNQYKSFKMRPREPEAINRNEQTHEVYCTCKDQYISRIETERVTYCQCGKIIRQ